MVTERGDGASADAGAGARPGARQRAGAAYTEQRDRAGGAVWLFGGYGVVGVRLQASGATAASLDALDDLWLGSLPPLHCGGQVGQAAAGVAWRRLGGSNSSGAFSMWGGSSSKWPVVEPPYLVRFFPV